VLLENHLTFIAFILSANLVPLKKTIYCMNAHKFLDSFHGKQGCAQKDNLEGEGLEETLGGGGLNETMGREVLEETLDGARLY
jgi:hypothetical protein